MLKRFISLTLSLALLASCAAPATESPAPAELETPEPVTAETVAQAILNSQPGPEGYRERAGEELEFYLALYGVDRDVVGDAAIYTAEGVDGREVAVFSLSHGTYAYDTASTAAALETYRQNRLGDFFGYSPDQAALVGNGGVVTAGSWVALLLCQDMPAAQAAFETATGEAGNRVEPTFSDDSVPFDPPNKFDMTLYDTSAIRAAWESGEDSGLSEKDAAILDRCREIFREVDTEGKSDYQKELALHDWLVAWGSYDQSVHDPHTPFGREDNNDPYGMLVKGYGICLGYATTFQLLMDLAGVECITVVGASASSSSDHAWNMVRLEGEWYCVDPTWDDGTSYTTERERHQFFNVTSQQMRETDHQWDYENVPEATATRFRWDGTGALPQ